MPHNRAIPPSLRWAELPQLLSRDDDPPTAGAILAEGEMEAEIEQMVEEAESLAKEIGAPPQLLELSRRMENACTNYGSLASERSYDVGYGDGWHAGALVMLRMISGAAGITVPNTSPALAFLIGLPGSPLRSATEATAE